MAKNLILFDLRSVNTSKYNSSLFRELNIVPSQAFTIEHFYENS